MKNLQDYRAVIFDVDGTLYYHEKLRWIMVRKLLREYLLRPHRLTDLQIIGTFRRLRENPSLFNGDLEHHQYQIVADKLRIPLKRVKSLVERWIFEEPLPYLQSCRDEHLATIIHQIRSLGSMTIAYSDYLAVDKLKALDLPMDHIFAATDPMIDCLKPNPRGLQSILEHLSLSARECFFIGDRDEKDGACARKVGMDFIILPKTTVSRAKLYQLPPLNLSSSIQTFPHERPTCSD